MKTNAIALNAFVCVGAFCMPTHTQLGHVLDFCLAAEIGALGIVLIQRVIQNRTQK